LVVDATRKCVSSVTGSPEAWSRTPCVLLYKTASALTTPTAAPTISIRRNDARTAASNDSQPGATRGTGAAPVQPATLAASPAATTP
jgi:hypothetical protein